MYTTDKAGAHADTERVPKPKIAAIVGPTASGKSGAAIEAALRFNGEIVSCDSMQIYKGMDIGTAKVSASERALVPHHMTDIVMPCENYSCAQYAHDAEGVTRDIIARGKLPIFCGGTGQYLDAVLTGNTFSQAGTDEELRARLNVRDGSELWAELERIDPESAHAVHANNKKRVVRALETYYLTGMTKSEWDRQSRTHEMPFDALVIGLYFEDRQRLYERINERVDRMFLLGLEDEVRRLDGTLGTTARAAIGYKELTAYLRGECSLDEAREAIKTASRRYAKRQMTWFRSKPYVHPVSADGGEESIKSRVFEMIEGFLGGDK